VICEISQNIRYQYNFIILWFFFTVGLLVSAIGFLNAILQMVKSLFWMYYPKFFKKDNPLSHRVHAQLTLREMEYLEKIREIDMTMYGEILRELIRFKPDIHAIKKFAPQANSESIVLLPTAPVNEWNGL